MIVAGRSERLPNRVERNNGYYERLSVLHESKKVICLGVSQWKKK